jgi:hypothetical protein
MRLKGERPTSASAGGIKRTPPSPASSGATSGSLRRTGATKTASLPARAPSSSATIASARATSGAASLRLPSPPPFREYPDRIELTNKNELSCKILGDMGATLRIELANGVIVHMPKQRLAEVNGKALPR